MNKSKNALQRRKGGKVLFSNTILRLEGQMKIAEISEPYTRNWNSSIQQGM